MGFCCCLLNKSPKRVDKARPAYWVHKNYIALPGAIPNLGPCFDHHHNECKNKGWLVLYPSPLFPSRAAFWPLLAGFEARQPLLNPWQGQGRKKKPTTETTSRTTAPTSRGPRRWGGNPATPTASSGHPPTRKTDFLLALTFSARHAALLVVLAVQLALVVVVGAAHATAPVVGLWWVPGLVSRLDGQHKALGEAHLLCRGRQARAGEPPRGSVSRPARSTRS